MKSFQNIIDSFISSLVKELPKKTVVHKQQHLLELNYEGHHCSMKFFLSDPDPAFKGLQIPVDLAFTRKQKLIAIIQSKLHYTRTVYARDCIAKKIQASGAEAFLNEFHLMNHAKAAYHYGLFDTGELVAVATFSKGRKMNRLKKEERSFELIRFCCKEGISVSGGLSKLLSCFIKDKKPGDIMTYIDKQFSDGKSYYACGFRKHSETPVYSFLIHQETLQRNYSHDSEFDNKKFYLCHNLGNIKLVYQIEYPSL